MLSFLFTVLMLTVLFGVTAGLAFVFRKCVLRNRESGMYYIWLVVLAFAVIPIRIGQPRIVLFPQDNQQAETEDIEVSQNTTLSELINMAHYNSYVYDEIEPYTDIRDRNTMLSEMQYDSDTDMHKPRAKSGMSINDILKFLDKTKDMIMYALISVWIVGGVFVFVKSMYGYIKMKRLFLKESDICDNDRVYTVFAECLAAMKINRGVNLRVLRWDFTSPCVCGLMNPVVFIDSSCVSLSDKKLRYIFTHELYHIKRYDILYKIFAVIVVSVHWFNPLSYRVIRAVNEDCELSVDRTIINMFGSGQSDYYMNIILDMAEKKCTGNSKVSVNIPHTSLFFGEKRSMHFLKRRYSNMKNVINKKYLIVVSSLFLALMILINATVMSSCGVVTAENGSISEQSKLSNEKVYDDANVFEAALRNYFGLLPNEEITQEQLDSITDIKIIKGIDVNGRVTDNIGGVALGDMTPVSFVINDWEMNMLPAIVHKKIFDEYIIKSVIFSNIEIKDEEQGKIAEDLWQKYIDVLHYDGEIDFEYVLNVFNGDKESAEELFESYPDEESAYVRYGLMRIILSEYENYFEGFAGMYRTVQKLNAYYALKNLSDPTLTEEAKEEILLNYPIAADFPIYVFDPNSSEREYTELLGYFAKAGLLDNSYVKNDLIHPAFLSMMPNLKTITLIGGIHLHNENLLHGVTIVDSLPDTVNVTIEERVVKTTPIEPASSATVGLAYEKGYRDSIEYTKFADSTFAQRMDNVSEEEQQFIYNCLCAGECPPISDDIVGLATAEGAIGIKVILELADGSYVEFEMPYIATSSSKSSQPLSGVFEPPNYGINVVENFYGREDGAEYVELENDSLKAALFEYFGVLPWSQYLSPEMLAEIISIEVKRRPEYDYIYDFDFETDIPIKGMYIEYTINGKTLDILPNPLVPEMEMIFEQESLDINQYCDRIVYEILDDGGEMYHYEPKADLSDKDKLMIYKAAADRFVHALDIYQNDNGEYFTVAYGGMIYMSGFAARYYNQTEYNASDFKYMPNLKNFNIDLSYHGYND